MKFERIYLFSGTNKRRDSSDCIDYYRAENGMIIAIVESINMSGRFYDVFKSVDSYNNHDRCIFSFDTLRDAKTYVENY